MTNLVSVPRIKAGTSRKRGISAKLYSKILSIQWISVRFEHDSYIATTVGNTARGHITTADA
jgi:hypothetical protein